MAVEASHAPRAQPPTHEKIAQGWTTRVPAALGHLALRTQPISRAGTKAGIGMASRQEML